MNKKLIYTSIIGCIALSFIIAYGLSENNFDNELRQIDEYYNNEMENFTSYMIENNISNLNEKIYFEDRDTYKTYFDIWDVENTSILSLWCNNEDYGFRGCEMKCINNNYQSIPYIYQCFTIYYSEINKTSTSKILVPTHMSEFMYNKKYDWIQTQKWFQLSYIQDTTWYLKEGKTLQNPNYLKD